MTALVVCGCLAAFYLISLIWTGYKGFFFPVFFKKTGSGVKRVACVGDSITYGYHIDNWYSYQYPRFLQILLGKAYYVRNFGKSGSTGMRSGKMPYRRYPVFGKSQAFLPDIVVVMFGTNDANSQNWKGREAFLSEYRELLQSYHSLPSKPDLFIMTPPALFRVATAEDAAMNEHIEAERGCVLELAAELDCRVIDLFAETQGHRDWFQEDGVHPNAKGAMEIAHIVYEKIKPEGCGR